MLPFNVFGQSTVPEAYEAVDIGANDRFVPAAINSRGEVVFDIFLYTPLAGLRQIGNPAGVPTQLNRGDRFTAISDTGIFGGSSSIQVGGPGSGQCAFTAMMIPSNLTENFPLIPSEITASRQVAGTCVTSNCNFGEGRETFACYYGGIGSGTSFTFGDSGVTINMGTAAAVNASGVIVGNSSRFVSGMRVQRAFSVANGATLLVDLGTFGGFLNSRATDISDDGAIVGNGYESSGESRPFFRPAGGGNTAIPLLASDTDGVVNALNNSGLAVGSSGVAFGEHRAIIYQLGQSGSQDLNSLVVPPLSDWSLTEAYDINEAGEIVVQGTREVGNDTESKIFVLRPRTTMFRPINAFTADSVLSSNAVWRPSLGQWFVRNNLPEGTPFPNNSAFSRQWGLSGDVPVAGNYDADMKSDLTVWRPTNGTWYQLLSESEFSLPRITQFGLPGDIPLRGDFDGDGFDDIAVWRPANGSWYIRRSSDDAVVIIQWGLPNDLPAPQDFDGDARDDLAVWRPSSGEWYVLLSSNSFGAAPGQILYRQWGLSGDVPVPGDYDGDGIAEIAVWRPVNGTWYLCSSRLMFDCTRAGAIQFGLEGDIPLSGVYLDSDVYSLTVYRPRFGLWISRGPETLAFKLTQWGLSGDLPLGRSFTSP